MKRIEIKIFLLIILLSSFSNASALERRKDQFLREPSYMIVPLPYSIAGIGDGIVVTGLVGNVADTNVDAYLLGITGDAGGYILTVEDIHLLPEMLILDLNRQDVNKAVVYNYEKRGMETGRKDYKLIEVDRADSNRARLTLSLFDRRLELFGGIESFNNRVIMIRDSSGAIIENIKDNPYVSRGDTHFAGLVVDYTDDRQDPKKGARVELSGRSNPSRDDNAPDYYVIDQSLTLYLPVSRNGTWALNYFASDANVTSEGDTDPANIRQELGFNCDIAEQECLDTEQELVDTFIAQRKYGTSASLGGENRLRSYPRDRYSGAHALYFGTELRWNFSRQVKPFNYWIWKDIATGIQLAIFYERGSVAEKKQYLGETWRSSYGAGLRLVSASGYVYRVDMATGKEGGTMAIIFDYPW
ncbi:MAG: hypothetical protein RQ824_10225 [bacterium]|nr:hypothetical protein [bacterium]